MEPQDLPLEAISLHVHLVEHESESQVNDGFNYG